MSLGAHLARIWRRRFLIAATTLLAGLVAFGVAGRHSGTRYTGTATLVTMSQNSSPDQVAVLATGYVDTFIQPSFQQILRARLDLPADVSLTAQTAAQSPIISISATAPDTATAQRAAGEAADEFLREVNGSLQAGRQGLIDQMRRAVAADTQDTTGEIRVPAEIDMQDRINGVNADPTNDLQILQSNAGVTAVSSGAKRTIGVGLAGGLVFGCLLAWVLGAATRRLSSPAELVEKARIEPLVVIPPGGGPTAELQRERQLRQLSAAVALLDLPKPAVVAVAPVEQTPAAWPATGRVTGCAPFWCTQTAHLPRSAPSGGTSSPSATDGCSCRGSRPGQCARCFQSVIRGMYAGCSGWSTWASW